MVDKDSLLDWCKKNRRELCPKCNSQPIPYSLIKTTAYCPRCDRIWKFKYHNPEDMIKKALRLWYFVDDPKGTITRVWSRADSGRKR